MKNKVGIITLNGYFNYGNRLQNYALEQSMLSLGFDAETIVVDESYLSKYSDIDIKKSEVPKSLLKIMDVVYLKFKKTIFAKAYDLSKKNRYACFRKFSEKYLHETEFSLISDTDAEKIEKQFSYFVVGSDQVWNPNYTKCSPIYFLRFTNKNKRIAYAPSFSVSEIPDKSIDKYKNWISDFEYLSVREEDGARLIKELTEINAPVLVDPTMLLTSDQWAVIANKASNKPNKYIVTYFLGGVDEALQTEYSSFAKINNYSMINLGNIKDKETYETGPSEFIDYIKDASLILTDSFHGVVFSILFKRPFVVYERRGKEQMYARIETLLDTFSLNDREYKKISLDESIFQMNFEHVDDVLKKERQRSFDFLKKGFNLID